MELEEFLHQTQAEVRSAIAERLGASGEAYPYPESVFAEIVMQHMSEVGIYTVKDEKVVQERFLPLSE